LSCGSDVLKLAADQAVANLVAVEMGAEKLKLCAAYPPDRLSVGILDPFCFHDQADEVVVIGDLGITLAFLKVADELIFVLIAIRVVLVPRRDDKTVASLVMLMPCRGLYKRIYRYAVFPYVTNVRRRDAPAVFIVLMLAG